MTRAVGLVDLLTLLDQFPPGRAEVLARCLGFDGPTAIEGVVPRAPLVHEDELVELPGERLVEVASEPPPVPPEALPPPPDITYWRAETYEPADEKPTVAPPPSAPLARAQIDPRRRPTRRPLPWPSLTPWARLWPLLHASLQRWQSGRRPDVDAFVRRLATAALVRAIPRLPRRAWATRVHVWHDRSHRLIPFWGDQDEVERRLRALLGRAGVGVILLHEAAQAELFAGRGAAADARREPCVVLVLGDLGLYASDALRVRWRRALAALARDGVDVTALVPAPSLRLAALAEVPARVVAWERTTGTAATPVEVDARSPAAAQLLRLVAMAGFVEPALLREMRQALPAAAADAATEVELWRDPEVYAPDSNGLVVRSEGLDRWRGEFARRVAPEVKRRVAEAITRRHGAWAEELLHAETLVWTSHREGAVPGDLAAATEFVRHVTAASRDERDPMWAEEARAWARSFLQEGIDDDLYARVPALQRLWASAFRGLDVRVPAHIDRPALDRELGGSAVRRALHLRQVGGALRLSAEAGQGAGSPVGTLATSIAHVVIDDGREVRQHAWRDALAVPLRRRTALRVSSDEGRLTVAPWTPAASEPWMSATGRDASGLWVEFAVRGVAHRLRWIPPGRLWMGSPEGEDGRYEDEGPRHAVDLTRGYWLGETPVTQGLWEAVMGANPSGFKGADRPVEQVSWEDCAGFMARLEGAVPGLGARFPTEAEWERACRGGTEGATWLGGNDARTLDAIAWWSGNSGRETRPVRQKAANPYGLYDMLGNVWEWCADYRRPYEASSVRDPCGPTDSPYQVHRGGSWDSDAWLVRAAFRGANHASRRVDVLGFRLARGQDLRSSSGRQEAAEGQGARTAGRGPGGASTRAVSTPRDVNKPRGRSR